MEKTCEIVKDLLVPYIDDTCSTESRNFLEEHISECEKCRSELEKYRSQEITVNVAENIGSKKPFKKIKRRLRVMAVIICLLTALILPVVIYNQYAGKYGYYEADKRFLGLEDTDFVYADYQWLTFFIEDMYEHTYYNRQIRNGTYKEHKSFDELKKERETISQIELDIKNMKVWEYDASYGEIEIYIPLILKNDDQATVYIHGTRTSPGIYNLSYMQLITEDMIEQKYINMSHSIGSLLEEYDLLPSTMPISINVYATKKYEPKKLSSSSKLEYSDTGKKLDPGTYVYKDEENNITIEVFENGEITYKNNVEWSYEYPVTPSIMPHIYDVSEPCQYFIVKNNKGGTNLMIRYKKTGIRALQKIVVNDNGELCYRESENPFTKIK